jgi:predicted Zn-dependent protease
MRKFLAVSIALAVAALLPAKDNKKDPTEIGNRNVSGGVNFYSLEKELALGKQLAIEVRKQVKIVEDPVVSEYVNRLGQNLVRNSDVTFPVSFEVIDSAEINASTLPGGHIFVNTGLMTLSANESQLAAAMAHEPGHAAARHATRQATRDQIAGFGTIPLPIFGGWTGAAKRAATNAAIPVAFLKFSREFENEADLPGLEYLWEAGYDPDAWHRTVREHAVDRTQAARQRRKVLSLASPDAGADRENTEEYRSADAAAGSVHHQHFGI